VRRSYQQLDWTNLPRRFLIIAEDPALSGGGSGFRLLRKARQVTL